MTTELSTPENSSNGIHAIRPQTPPAPPAYAPADERAARLLTHLPPPSRLSRHLLPWVAVAAAACEADSGSSTAGARRAVPASCEVFRKIWTWQRSRRVPMRV